MSAIVLRWRTRRPVSTQGTPSTPVAAIIGPPGPPGPEGPDPWDEPIQIFDTVSGALEIDYALGKYAELTLTGDTAITVANWPQTERNARLTLEIVNSGSFTITAWPTGTVWSYGLAPAITPNGRDVIVLTTVDGGERVYGHIVGQNYL